MKKFASFMMTGAALCAATASIGQTASDNNRLQVAGDRFNRELSLYRTTTNQNRGAYNRSGGNNAQRAQDRFDNELTAYRQELDRYQSVVRSNRYATGNNGYNNGNNAYNGNGGAYANRDADDGYYDASRDYRDGNYQERVVNTDERVYRGTDNRYYCKRTDGTTGLIVGGLGGSLIGGAIDGGHSKILGTLLGGVAGAFAGRAVERGADTQNGQVRCR